MKDNFTTSIYCIINYLEDKVSTNLFQYLMTNMINDFTNGKYNKDKRNTVVQTALCYIQSLIFCVSINSSILPQNKTKNVDECITNTNGMKSDIKSTQIHLPLLNLELSFSFQFEVYLFLVNLKYCFHYIIYR